MSGNRPNILWICTDQQRADTIGALGNEYINTPNLDRLCREGTAFTRAFCQSPICTPSRASFLTGLYPSTVHGNINGNARFTPGERFRLITKRLADVGYTCGLSGKLHIASAWNGSEERTDDGYSEFHFSHSPTQTFDRNNQYVAWLQDSGKLDAVLDSAKLDRAQRRGVKYREDVPAELHQTAWCTDRTIDFMQTHQHDPWLMSVNIFDPHPPYDAPGAYADRYDPDQLPEPVFVESDLEHQNRLASHFFQTPAKKPDRKCREQLASYYGMIELVDENVGRMLRTLEETGQRENTMVIFTSDHGNLIGDHGLSFKGCRFYEGLVRVPLIVSWPGHVQQGSIVEALVELTDIVPTLADCCGADLAWTHGRSLRPLLCGEEPEFRPHEYVRCEFYDTLNMETPSGNPDAHVPSYATMYRTDQWKLNVYHGNEYGELFDLAEDPDECNNLWEDPGVRDIKNELIRKSFDASMVITDPGPERIGRF